MDKNADLYANIYNTVIMDQNRPVQKVSPLTHVSITAGHFNGVDVPVNTVIIEDDGVVSITVQFDEGQVGYETQIHTWATNEEHLRKAAQNAYDLIMRLNQWEALVA
jgi:hypothetical protein